MAITFEERVLEQLVAGESHNCAASQRARVVPYQAGGYADVDGAQT